MTVRDLRQQIMGDTVRSTPAVAPGGLPEGNVGSRASGLTPQMSQATLSADHFT